MTRYNDRTPSILTGDFIPRNDMAVRWGLAVSSYLALPKLRHFTVPTPHSELGHLLNLPKGASQWMTNGNNTQWGQEGMIPYVEFNGATPNYFTASDATLENGWDILGTEAYIETADRGMTVLAWGYPTSAGSGTTRSIHSKMDNSVSGAWNWGIATNNTVYYQNRTPVKTTFSSNAVNLDDWNFMAARWDPGTEQWMNVNGTETTDTTSINASQPNTALNPTIGHRPALSAYPFYGKLCLLALCAMAVDKQTIRTIYEQTKVLFGQGFT